MIFKNILFVLNILSHKNICKLWKNIVFFYTSFLAFKSTIRYNNIYNNIFSKCLAFYKVMRKKKKEILFNYNIYNSLYQFFF